MYHSHSLKSSFVSDWRIMPNSVHANGVILSNLFIPAVNNICPVSLTLNRHNTTEAKKPEKVKWTLEYIFEIYVQQLTQYSWILEAVKLNIGLRCSNVNCEFNN